MPSFSPSHTLFCIAALAACSVASAAPVSLGSASAYNLVSLSHFDASNSSIGGAVAVAGNMQVSGYSINGQGATGNTLVVGGDLDVRNMSLHGQVAVGGQLTAQGTNLKAGQASTGGTPLDFAAMAKEMQDLSQGLARLGATGSAADAWGGLKFTGSQSAVEIFNVTGALLSGYGWSSLTNLQAGSTVIFNISGKTADVHGGIPGALSGYNVLYNFFEAETLNISGTSLYGSVLAPDALVQGGNGKIFGTVVAGDWNSSITLLAGNGFDTTEVAGYVPPALAAPAIPLPADGVQTVPEPGAMALMALALVLLVGTRAQRRTGRPART